MEAEPLGPPGPDPAPLQDHTSELLGRGHPTYLADAATRLKDVRNHLKQIDADREIEGLFHLKRHLADVEPLAALTRNPQPGREHAVVHGAKALSAAIGKQVGQFSEATVQHVFGDAVTAEHVEAVRRLAGTHASDTAGWNHAFEQAMPALLAFREAVNDPVVVLRLKQLRHLQHAQHRLSRGKDTAAQLVRGNFSSALSGLMNTSSQDDNLAAGLDMLSGFGRVLHAPTTLVWGTFRAGTALTAYGIRATLANTRQRIGQSWEESPKVPVEGIPADPERRRIYLLARRFRRAVDGLPEPVRDQLAPPTAHDVSTTAWTVVERTSIWNAAHQLATSRDPAARRSRSKTDSPARKLAAALAAGQLPAGTAQICTSVLHPRNRDKSRDQVASALAANPESALTRATDALTLATDQHLARQRLRQAAGLAAAARDDNRLPAAAQPLLTTLAALHADKRLQGAGPFPDGSAAGHPLAEVWQALPLETREYLSGFELASLRTDRDGNPVEDHTAAVSHPPGGPGFVPDFQQPEQARWASDVALALRRMCNVAAHDAGSRLDTIEHGAAQEDKESRGRWAAFSSHREAIEFTHLTAGMPDDLRDRIASPTLDETEASVLAENDAADSYLWQASLAERGQARRTAPLEDRETAPAPTANDARGLFIAAAIGQGRLPTRVERIVVNTIEACGNDEHPDVEAHVQNRPLAALKEASDLIRRGTLLNQVRDNFVTTRNLAASIRTSPPEETALIAGYMVGLERLHRTDPADPDAADPLDSDPLVSATDAAAAIARTWNDLPEAQRARTVGQTNARHPEATPIEVSWVTSHPTTTSDAERLVRLSATLHRAINKAGSMLESAPMGLDAALAAQDGGADGVFGDLHRAPAEHDSKQLLHAIDEMPRGMLQRLPPPVLGDQEEGFLAKHPERERYLWRQTQRTQAQEALHRTPLSNALPPRDPAMNDFITDNVMNGKLPERVARACEIVLTADGMQHGTADWVREHPHAAVRRAGQALHRLNTIEHTHTALYRASVAADLLLRERRKPGPAARTGAVETERHAAEQPFLIALASFVNTTERDKVGTARQTSTADGPAKAVTQAWGLFQPEFKEQLARTDCRTVYEALQGIRDPRDEPEQTDGALAPLISAAPGDGAAAANPAAPRADDGFTPDLLQPSHAQWTYETVLTMERSVQAMAQRDHVDLYKHQHVFAQRDSSRKVEWKSQQMAASAARGANDDAHGASSDPVAAARTATHGGAAPASAESGFSDLGDQVDWDDEEDLSAPLPEQRITGQGLDRAIAQSGTRPGGKRNGTAPSAGADRD